MTPLGRLQRGLETLYRVDTDVDVHDFVIDEAARDVFAPTRKPREQLLVMDAMGDLELALFIDPGVIASLERGIGRHNLGDFLLAIEGVSHFIYAILCARSERRVSQLELELQAEVDKYVTCLLHDVDTSEALRGRLFADCAYEPDLDRDERERYRVANDNAQRYAAFLEDEFVARGRIPDMLGELRRFYRQGLAGKLETIARAA